MNIYADKRTTGLSQDYELITELVQDGTVLVRVRKRTSPGLWSIIGSFVNPRQDIGDNRPMIPVEIFDAVSMAEVLVHWNKTQRVRIHWSQFPEWSLIREQKGLTYRHLSWDGDFMIIEVGHGQD